MMNAAKTESALPDDRARLMRAVGTRAIALVVAFGLAGIILAMIGVSPLDAARLIAHGAFGSAGKFAYVLSGWVPLLLVTAGVLLTFAAGLWNIGIEGQIVMGAIFTTGALRLLALALPPWAGVGAALVAAMLGGALWAGACGALRHWGKVNEIFGGLGLNFIANSFTVYLVLGPWKRPGIGSTSGTEPFASEYWLPFPAGFAVSPIEIALGLAALVLSGLLLSDTRFGLRLRATGLNARAAYIRGVATARHMMAAFLLGGALAGVAGWTLVVGASSRHNLYPLISGGYGFSAILVALLAGLSAWWSFPVSFFFAVIGAGSLQLSLVRQMDSAVGGVIQGLLVLSVLIAQGLETRKRER